jgi:ABC-type transporter Mla MlaB component
MAVTTTMGESPYTEPLLRIRGPITRPDLPGLCDRVCALLARRRSDIVVCDVHGVDSGAASVDALARLQLAARTLGCEIRLRHASPDLAALVELMGLADVLLEGGHGSSTREGGTGPAPTML